MLASVITATPASLLLPSLLKQMLKNRLPISGRKEHTICEWEEWAPPLIPKVLMGLFQNLRVLFRCGLSSFKGPRRKRNSANPEAWPRWEVILPTLPTASLPVPATEQDSSAQEKSTHFQPKWLFGVILKSWIEMSAELKLQWKVPGSVHLQRIHLQLPGTSFLHCSLWNKQHRSILSR